jgi:hypothetical protein
MMFVSALVLSAFVLAMTLHPVLSHGYPSWTSATVPRVSSALRDTVGCGKQPAA